MVCGHRRDVFAESVEVCATLCVLVVPACISECSVETNKLIKILLEKNEIYSMFSTKITNLIVVNHMAAIVANAKPPRD
jgi:hypothetical protein